MLRGQIAIALLSSGGEADDFNALNHEVDTLLSLRFISSVLIRFVRCRFAWGSSSCSHSSSQSIFLPPSAASVLV